MTSSYVKLLPPKPTLSPLQAGQSVETLQMKRYSSKILTLMFRDFLNSNKTMRSKISQPNVKDVFTLSLQVLMYYLPFYLESITFNQARFSGTPGDLDEEEDFETEFHTLIVQVLSLMSTLMSLYPK